MALVFFRPLEQMKGGMERVPALRGGVSGSLRQNRCFAAHSPAHMFLKSHDLFVLCVAMAELILTARGTRSEYQGNKQSFPPSTLYSACSY